MRGELIADTGTVLGFLLTLVRVAGVFVFVPIPGISSVLAPARVLLTLGITFALFGLWPHVSTIPSAGEFVMWIGLEAALGIGIGLSVAFVAESLAVGAQILGLQAGYSFASTIDPSTQADSTVLVILSQLASGLLFFTTGLDREVLRIFARSLETFPAGSFNLSRSAGAQIVAAGSTMLATGLRLALPVVAVLLMIDISLALLGRVNAQLHLLHIAFPVKMTVGLALLGWIAVLLPALFRATANTTLSAARGLLVH